MSEKQKENQVRKDNTAEASIANSDDKSIGVIVIEVVGLGVFGILSNNFFSTDYKQAGLWFSLATIASLLALLGISLARACPLSASGRGITAMGAVQDFTRGAKIAPSCKIVSL